MMKKKLNWTEYIYYRNLQLILVGGKVVVLIIIKFVFFLNNECRLKSYYIISFLCIIIHIYALQISSK